MKREQGLATQMYCSQGFKGSAPTLFEEFATASCYHSLSYTKKPIYDRLTVGNTEKMTDQESSKAFMHLHELETYIRTTASEVLGITGKNPPSGVVNYVRALQKTKLGAGTTFSDAHVWRSIHF